MNYLTDRIDELCGHHNVYRKPDEGFRRRWADVFSSLSRISFILVLGWKCHE